MAISRVGSAATTVATTGTSSGAVALPAGIASGDILILFVRRTADYALTSTNPPTGYTFLRTTSDGTSPNNAHVDIFWRACNGSEGTSGPTFTTGTGTRWLVHSLVYRGVDNTTPFIAENGQIKSGSSTSIPAPSITNTDANAWGVYAGACRDNPGVTWTAPSGMTEIRETDVGAGSSVNLIGELADTNGTVGTGAVVYTATTSTAQANATCWAAFLKPAGASNTPPTAGAGTDQVDVEPRTLVTLSGTDSDSDGTIASRQWTQTAGSPTVTLSGATTATATFLAPNTAAGTTLTFEYEVTDDDAATDADTMTVTVLPSSERVVIGGAWVPANMAILS
jgi:hypothetical protein